MRVTGESDTTNNCSSSVEVDVEALPPDLEVGAPSVDDSSPETGATFTLSATVSNTADGASAATTLRYYRSTGARGHRSTQGTSNLSSTYTGGTRGRTGKPGSISTAGAKSFMC